MEPLIFKEKIAFHRETAGEKSMEKICKKRGFLFRNPLDERWRCRVSNPGRYGYEPYALPPELHRLGNPSI